MLLPQTFTGRGAPLALKYRGRGNKENEPTDIHQFAVQNLHESVSWENMKGVGSVLQDNRPETSHRTYVRTFSKQERQSV